MLSVGVSHWEALSPSRIAAASVELLLVVTAAELTVGGENEEGISKKAKGFIDKCCEWNYSGFLSEVVDWWLEDGLINSGSSSRFLKYLDTASAKTFLVPSRYWMSPLNVDSFSNHLSCFFSNFVIVENDNAALWSIRIVNLVPDSCDVKCSSPSITANVSLSVTEYFNSAGLNFWEWNPSVCMSSIDGPCPIYAPMPINNASVTRQIVSCDW